MLTLPYGCGHLLECKVIVAAGQVVRLINLNSNPDGLQSMIGGGGPADADGSITAC